MSEWRLSLMRHLGGVDNRRMVWVIRIGVDRTGIEPAWRVSKSLLCTVHPARNIGCGPGYPEPHPY